MPDLDADTAAILSALPDPTDYTCPFSDHIFAAKAGVELRLRLWPAPVSTPSPWVLWSHGGGFLFGIHEEVTPWVVPLLLRRGIHVVSFAYRFAPQASLADIISDANDAYAWCRAHLPTFLGSVVSLDSYAVAGDSAGGTIAAILAQTLSPPPRALLADHAVLDLADPVYDLPPNPENAQVPLSGEFSKAEVKAAARDNDPANAIITCPSPGRIAFGEEKMRRAFHSLTLVVGRRQRLQGDVSTFLSRSSWVDAGLRGGTKDERRAYAERYSPLRLLGGRREKGRDVGGENGQSANGVDGNGAGQVNGNGGDEGHPANDASSSNGNTYAHPPTFFIHGEADEIVPVVQSRDMAARLRALEVPVMEYYEPGAGHVFDQRFNSSRVKGYDECCVAAVTFLESHLRQT